MGIVLESSYSILTNEMGVTFRDLSTHPIVGCTLRALSINCHAYEGDN